MLFISTNVAAKTATDPMSIDIGVEHIGGSRIAIGEELLLSLYIKEHYIAEVFAIKTRGSIQVELQSLFSSLDFAISPQLDTEPPHYLGWFIEPKQSFFLNLKTNQAFIAGRTVNFHESQWRSLDEEVFVDASLLANWFRLNFVIDYQDLKIQVESQQTLPIEQRLARKNRTVATKSIHPQSVLPWQASPYQIWSAPLLDFQVGLKATENGMQADYTIQGSQDIAQWNTNYFIRGDEQELVRQSRLQARRVYQESINLGPLAVNQLELGDILGTQIGRGYQSAHALGVRMTNRPVYKEVDTQTVRISGEAQVGWDAELYHNGLMIGQQLNIQSGLYDFDNVELYFGSNEFEVVLYGPQGQIAQEVRSYYVTGNAVAKGEHYIDTSVIDNGSTLLGSDQTKTETSGWNLLTRFDYGLSDDIAIYSGFRFGLQELVNQYQIATGLSFDLWDRGLINLDFSLDDLGNQLAQLQGRTEVGGHAFSMIVNDRTRQSNHDQATKIHSREVYFRTSGKLYSYGSVRLNYQNTFSWEQFEQQSDFMATNMLAMTTRYGTFSNQLNYTRQSNLPETELFGAFRWQGRIGKTYSRVSLGYQLEPQEQLTDYQLQVSQSIGSDLDVEFDYTKSLLHDGYEVGMGLSWHNDRLRLIGDLSYQQDDTWQIGLTGQFSLGYADQSDVLLMTDRRLASTGSIVVKVFLDNNNNAVFDEQDEVLQGVRVKSIQSFAQAQTDTKGIALLTNMPLERKTDIVLDIDSLPDPFYIPAQDGSSVTPRRGFIAYLEYPVVNSGEIEGIAYKKLPDGDDQPLPYATIELVDKDNKVVAQSKSAFDGYYVFSNLRPGNYEARVKERPEDRLMQKEKVEVMLSDRGDVLLDVDLVVEQLIESEGVIASGGRFNSLSILKTYALILSKKSPHLFSTKPFYVYDKQQNNYLLGFAFYKNAERAAKACLKMTKNQIKCTAEKITLTL
ncbi:SpaA isopeptide-forming pilin-related protein [Pseudoalteromonas luteoviolacea]|uniref:SpaA isopeptide-forming pilin-related protein n=1 Tax=Pseudoalteromonas luteoviolacea TaxID=43657 RepID=UPI001151CA24|nr:hypothetical protein [Pseudoalteromonas luteoviolacea]TQF71885.1 hypothetical protein FLM44_12695 [Pseudoalteromonas luteoviolacea]